MNQESSMIIWTWKTSKLRRRVWKVKLTRTMTLSMWAQRLLTREKISMYQPAKRAEETGTLRQLSSSSMMSTAMTSSMVTRATKTPWISWMKMKMVRTMRKRTCLILKPESLKVRKLFTQPTETQCPQIVATNRCQIKRRWLESTMESH